MGKRVAQKMWIFMFHRDLRLEDNTALIELAERVKDVQVLPCFVFTHAQVSPKRNPLRSQPSIQFMIDSLQDLDAHIRSASKGHAKLHVFHGDDTKILKELLKDSDVEGLVENADYTPFAKDRQDTHANLCKQYGKHYMLTHDVYLTAPGSVLNKAGKTYQKFTRFYEHARMSDVRKPQGIPADIRWYPAARLGLKDQVGLSAMRQTLLGDGGEAKRLKDVIPGGRMAGLKILHGRFKDVVGAYAKDRDTPHVDTSRLSAHNHFGTVSIREVYWAARDSPGGDAHGGHEFIRQLYWRDFYGHICDAFESLYKVSPYDFMKEPEGHWRGDRKAKEEFKAWTEGRTGHALVDAGMRQLLAEGYIHNRARLVCASYLAKELEVHWRWGERWFAKHLVDYDFAQNFGNWCWVASVLPFSSAPFRRLDPERQLKLFDPAGVYVKNYLS